MKSDREKMTLQEGLDMFGEAILKLEGRLKLVEAWTSRLIHDSKEATAEIPIDKYILDENGEPKPEPNLTKWAEWYETSDRTVAKTDIGDSRISTVFLSINHNYDDCAPPILYETLVFGGPLDNEQERYETRKQAEKGHEAMVLRVEEASCQEEKAHAEDAS